MAVAPAKAAQPGGLNIKELLSNLDVDGDGDIDENDKAIAEALRSMDMDGDGTISIRELIKIGEVRVRNEKRIKNLTYAVFALCGLFVVFCAVMMALVVAANEATKDTRPSGDGTMKTVDGKVVSTESKKYPLILADLPRYPFEVIESLDALRVRKTGTQETYYYTVTGYSWFSKYSMQLHTARHDIISINGAGEGKPVAVTVISGEADGASFSVELAPEKTAAARRRLMQAPAPSPALAADLVEDQGGNGATGTLTGVVDTTDNVPATADTAPLASDTEPDQVTVEKWDTYYRMDMVFNYGTCILGAPDTVMGTEATMTYEKDVLDHFGELEVAEGVTAAVGMKETKAKIDAVLASKSKVENPGKRLFTKMQVDFVECCASIMPWPYPMGNVVPISKWPPVEKADTDNTEYNPTDIASLYGACYTKYNNAAKAAGKPQIKVAECASADATLYDATCMTIQIGGCMNKDAKNYNASATFDDATCVMPRVGCKAVLALNYDATLDAKDKNDPTKCVMPVPGCMDAAATNFVPLANKDPLLKIDDKVVDWKYEKNGDAGVMMMSPTMAGIKAQYDTRLITDSNNKPNSKPQVGSCMYNVKVWGCWDKMSTMYNPAATDHDYEMCEPMKEMVTGCMGVAATNYNVNATMESGLCTCEDNFTTTYEYPMTPATYTDAKNAAEYNAQVYGPMEPTFSCVATPPPPVVPAVAPAVAPAPAPAPTVARHLLAATPNGDACVAAADCMSGMCSANVCVAKPNGEGCALATDCYSDYCSAGVCMVKPTAVKANDGDVCVASADCKSDMCNAGVCVAKPEDKKDIGLPCQVSSDCKSDLCAAGICKAKTEDKKDIGATCVAAADCKSDMCNAGVCVAQSTGSGLLAATITNPNLAATAGNDGVAKAAELISTTAQAVNGPAAASVAYVPCRSTVYFNIDMSSTLAKADYDAVMTAVTAAAESMMTEEDTYVGVVGFRGPVTQTEFQSAADVQSNTEPTTAAAGTGAAAALLGASSTVTSAQALVSSAATAPAPAPAPAVVPATVPATTPATPATPVTPAPARRRLFASHVAAAPATASTAAPSAADIAAAADPENPLSMPFVYATPDVQSFKDQVGYGSYQMDIMGDGDASQKNPAQSDVGAGLKMAASETKWYEDNDASPRKKYIITLLANTPINMEKMKKQATAAKTAKNFLMFYNMNGQTVAAPTVSDFLASRDAAAGVRVTQVDGSLTPAALDLTGLVARFKAHFKATRETVAGKNKYCTTPVSTDDPASLVTRR